MQEVWRDIPGYIGMYQASNFGNIRALPRSVTYTNRYGKITHTKTTGGVMHPSKTGLSWKKKNCYLSVMFTIDGKQKRELVHRLVAKTFIPNPKGKSQVNHINGDKTNNRVENLEWVTAEENMHHATHEIKTMTSCYRPIQVACIETNEVFLSTCDAAKSKGLDRRGLSHAISKGNPYGGYHWVKVGNE